jgi:uncharacterized protein
LSQSYKDACKWYLEAAGQNQPTAQFRLGRLYDQGLGTPQNTTEAIKWYRKAIAGGDAEAEEYLRALEK